MQQQWYHYIVVPALMLGVFLGGCGYDPSNPPYDTDANPEGFPQKAVGLIEQIESGQLRTADAITNEFGDLYSSHPRLLGDAQWSEVLDKIGWRLEHRAKQLIVDGLSQFEQAAHYYIVAAQIHPNDSGLAQTAGLFRVWLTAIAKDEISTETVADAADTVPLGDRLVELMRFALRDSSHFVFARQYLAPAIVADISLQQVQETVASLDPAAADLALLASLDVIELSPDSGLVQFENPEIKLLTGRLTALDSVTYRIELYFVSGEPVSDSLGVAFWVETTDSLLRTDKQPAFPYDFDPVYPAYEWKANEVQAAIQRFTFTWPIDAIDVGLYRKAGGKTVPLPIVGADRVRKRLAVPIGGGWN